LLQFSVSPLELAIETLDETNQKIQSQIDQHLADPSLKVDTLGMILNGVVDAAVNGGIANYKVSVEF
jgi:dedicator of cytokinesis protein 1